MDPDKQSLIAILIIVGIVCGGMTLLIAPTYLILPLLLKISAKDAISILSTYKLSLFLHIIAISVFIFGVINVTIYFTKKVSSKEMTLGFKMTLQVYIIIFMFSGIGLAFINDTKDNFSDYRKVSSELKQYKSGDVEYTDVMIYMDTETTEFDRGAMMYISDNFESECVFDSLKTFDPYATDEDFEGVNKRVTRIREMFTYYLLPENVDFEPDQVQKVDCYDGETEPLDVFYDSLEPLYANNAIYRIGYTSQYGIIYSIEKITK